MCNEVYKRDWIFYKDPITLQFIKKSVNIGNLCNANDNVNASKKYCIEHNKNQLECQIWFNEFYKWSNDGITNINDLPYPLQWYLYKYYTNIISFIPSNANNFDNNVSKSNIFIFPESKKAECYSKNNEKKWTQITVNPPFSIHYKYNLEYALKTLGHLNKYIIPYNINKNIIL